MRRIVIAIGSTLTGLVLLFSWPTSLNRTTAAGLPATTGTTAAGTTTGAAAAPAPAAAAAPAATSGTFNGKVTAAKAVAYPSGGGRDQQINGYAIPILNSEAVSASSASIQMVSGATFTSNGYINSLQSALDQAKL